MKYQRTQIYLDPGEHKELLGEAASRGTSLAGLVREIVASHLREKSAVYGAKKFDAIIGIASADEPTDVAAHEEEYRGEALEARYRKKIGLPPRSRPGKPRRR